MSHQTGFKMLQRNNCGERFDGKKQLGSSKEEVMRDGDIRSGNLTKRHKDGLW